jgi:hypothetical protein
MVHFSNDSPGEEALTAAARGVCDRLLSPSAQLHGQQQTEDKTAEASLSRLVAALCQRLYTADNKHLTVILTSNYTINQCKACLLPPSSLDAARRLLVWRPPFLPCTTPLHGAASPLPERKQKKLHLGMSKTAKLKSAAVC